MQNLVDGIHKYLRGDPRDTSAVQENVLVQLENPRTHPSVAVRLGRGDLGLHAWVFKIETGQVFAFQPSEGQFLPLTVAPTPLPPRHLGTTI